MLRHLLVLLSLILPLSASGQARSDCPMRPKTLAEMRGCYRPLLVFAPSTADARLVTQRKALDAAADDMMDRNVLLIPIAATGAKFEAPLDAPYAMLDPAERAAARKHFGAAPGAFKVVLLGEDGGAKLQSSTPVAVERLNGLIDSMPTRKAEMQRPHSN